MLRDSRRPAAGATDAPRGRRSCRNSWLAFGREYTAPVRAVHHSPPRRSVPPAAQDLYVTPLVLCGLGMGAVTAVTFAAAFPALVAGVVLCELWPQVLCGASRRQRRRQPAFPQQQQQPCLSSAAACSKHARLSVMILSSLRTGGH